MDPYPSTAGLLFLMLTNALLTAGRTALTVLPDSTVRKMGASENPKERFISRLLETPAAFLDGIKLGGFVCSAAAALYAFPLAQRALSLLLSRLGLGPRFPHAVSYGLTLLAFALVALVLDVFCLLLPYRLASRHPQAVSAALARFCWLVSRLMAPFVAVNGALAGFLARLVGVRPGEDPEQVTEEEIRLMVDVGNEKGAIEQSEKDMINNIFEFDDRNVSEVMTHRTDMIAVSHKAPIDAIISVAIETGFSRIPVYDEDIDDIMGILYVKDLLCLVGKHGPEFDVRKYMRSALFVPENMSCVDLFAQFKQAKVMIAIAVDEYGGTAGLVSMEDLLESIVGNIQDEYDDEDEEISQLGENCYSLDGAVSIEDVERLFDITLDQDSDYDTIGGLLTETLQRIPGPNEHPAVTLEGVRFTVLLVEDRHIARIRAER